jgi:hypothetical protein
MYSGSSKKPKPNLHRSEIKNPSSHSSDKLIRLHVVVFRQRGNFKFTREKVCTFCGIKWDPYFILLKFFVGDNLRVTQLSEVRGRAIPLQAYYKSRGFYKFEALKISRQSAHEGDRVFSPTHWLPLHPRKHSWYSFLLETESTPGPQCGRKDYANYTSEYLKQLLHHVPPGNCTESAFFPVSPDRHAWWQFTTTMVKNLSCSYPSQFVDTVVL